MKMFEVHTWNHSIAEREVAKTTAQFAILPNGQREGLTTTSARWFPTASEAVAFCIEELTRISKDKTVALAKINQRLAELKSISMRETS